eukprot:1351447-Prorocentrum_lima.AAC.1
MTIVADASSAPGVGESHEGVTIYHGPNLIYWRSGKQSLTAVSSCEAELVGMVAGIQQWNQSAIELGRAIPNYTHSERPDSAFGTRFTSMRAHFVHDLVNADLLTVQLATQDNAADALPKGSGATSHRKARLLLFLARQ